ncbi:testis-expressed protein 101 isoform X3 [Monodelphis domestica]|uniref:testis-expressed protein 101 isoform X3 n=1 Tax=Monodelphis domestica TaxID=13616 RepID=UPI0024E20AAD|nr:testis-expressed protein 101 isoform X3 [Monodelphis domestica]
MGNRILGPEGQGGPKTGRKVHGAAMGCPSFPLLLGLVGAFLGQPEDRFDNPVFPVLRHVICYRTEMLHIGRKLSSKPVHWSRGRNQTARCESWEVCQETLVMVDTGPQTLIVGSKGCTPAGMRMSQVTHHLGPTGIIVTSYVRFCNFNYCNNSSSTAAVLTFRAPPVTADSEQALYCPTCLALYSCPDKIRFRQCSEDAISCYNGTIHIKGDSSSYNLSLLGCSSLPKCELFLSTEKIGPFTLSDKCLDHHDLLWPRSQGAPQPAWAWTLGLGLLLTL